jgi:hypothetical protein
MGCEDEVEQSFGRPVVRLTAGPSGHANSPHPSSREGHHSTVGYVQSSKMVHAALLLLMLEAVHGPRFTISLKRSTPNF